MVNIDSQPYPFDDVGKDILRDTITPTFGSNTDTYVYRKSGTITSTIVITYTDSTKTILQSITKS